MKKVAVIGSGALGTAFANVLVDSNKDNKIVIYGIDQNELNDLKNGKNTKYFPDLDLNKFNTTNDIKEALNDADYVILAVPSNVIDTLMEQIIQNSNRQILIINGCKGFYPNTDKPLHGGLVEKTKGYKNVRGVVTIAGPSFAIEIAKRALTTVAAISEDIEHVKETQKLFSTNYFKLYRQTDVVGAEIGGIYKNVLAIGAGMLNQLGFKINTLASYLTRGMKELSVFNKFMGGNDKTIYGLTGLGDLILTATDTNSRNFTYGTNFVKGERDTKNVTVEGLKALEVIEKIREKNNLYLPIQAALYNIIYRGSELEDEIKNLWTTDLKDED